MGTDYRFFCKKCKGYVTVDHGGFDRYGDLLGRFILNHTFKCDNGFTVVSEYFDDYYELGEEYEENNE
jgi:hypothetical protein